MPLTAWIAKPLAHLRLPKIDGQIRLAGLHAPVEILRDDWGVPHIYAQDLHDLFFAQGFVHGQDRLFQMDYHRRLVAGRLAEVLGERALPADRWMRSLTLRRVAEYEVNLLNQEARACLQAYANGVNSYLAQGRLPLEFTLLRYRPAPWVIADTLAWNKMLAGALSVNWESELLRARLVERLGPDLAAELEPVQPQRWPFVIPPGSDYSYIGANALERARQARPFTGPSPYDGLGSNNWVLAGERTATGMPLLANDMHLTLTAPALWYENHLVCSAAGETACIDATGITFPGVAGIIAGHNGSVAWGLTNGFPDVQDLYLERLRRQPDGSVQAEYNGTWEEVRVLHETIQVRGKPPVSEEVVITRHGPVINRMAPDFAGEQPLALRWTALEPDSMTHAILDMLRARDVHAFHQALQPWSCPAQNVVYADMQGNIAYTFAGRIPVRARGQGRLPVPGWNSEYEWTGYLPFDSLPHMVNPPQGYIVTANNRVTGADYPLAIELEPINGDRAQRIAELILDAGQRGGQEQIDIPFIQKMQFDQLSPSARVVSRFLAQLPLDLSAHTPETELHAAVRLFRDWDGTQAAESPAAALYQVFIRRLATLMLGPRLDPGHAGLPRKPGNTRPRSGRGPLTERFMGKGTNLLLADKGWAGEHWLPWLINRLAEPDSPWFAVGNERPDRDQMVRRALQAAFKELQARQGPEPRRWQWGRLHRLTFKHPLAAHPWMANLFNLGPFPIGGDHTTIWAASANYHNLSENTMTGPPYRMIIDLGDLTHSLSMLAPGQSGNLASPQYADQIQPWLNAGYHPMLYAREQVEQHSQHRLHLINL